MLVGFDCPESSSKIPALQSVPQVNCPLTLDTLLLTEPGQAVEPFEMGHQYQVNHGEEEQLIPDRVPDEETGAGTREHDLANTQLVNEHQVLLRYMNAFPIEQVVLLLLLLQLQCKTCIAELQQEIQIGEGCRVILIAVREIRARGVKIPLILMGYYNPMLAYGLEKFVRDAINAGADEFIVPDLPLEDGSEFTSVLTGADSYPALPLIQMLARTTSNERMEKIAINAQGFIYLVSVMGVTGERKSLA
jgi:hypothetical protein